MFVYENVTKYGNIRNTVDFSVCFQQFTFVNRFTLGSRMTLLLDGPKQHPSSTAIFHYFLSTLVFIVERSYAVTEKTEWRT